MTQDVKQVFERYVLRIFPESIGTKHVFLPSAFRLEFVPELYSLITLPISILLLFSPTNKAQGPIWSLDRRLKYDNLDTDS